jgi:hypothetical protein
MDTPQVALIVSAVSAAISGFSVYIAWSTRRSVVKAGLPRFRLYSERDEQGNPRFKLQNLGKTTAVEIRVAVQAPGHHESWSYPADKEILTPDMSEITLQARDFPSRENRPDWDEYQLGAYWELATCRVIWMDPADRKGLLTSNAFVDIRSREL